MRLGINGLIVIVTALLAGWFQQSSAAPFPLNFNLDSLQRADKQPSLYAERLIAFKGIVTQTKQLPDGLPYFFVKLPDPNPKAEGIWVKSFSNAKPTDVLVGHMIVVLGYFMGTDPKDEAVAAIHKKAYHVAGLCIANGTTQTGIYAKDATSVCQQWQNGIMPQDPKVEVPKAKVVDPPGKK